MTSASTQPRAPDVPKLAWDEFSIRYFPDRRRHDSEAVQAYGRYRRELPIVERGSRGSAVEVWEGEGGR